MNSLAWGVSEYLDRYLRLLVGLEKATTTYKQ
jgi:hypothetical protein